MSGLEPTRAARLALRHAASFPESYRTVNSAAEAAHDIERLATLADGSARLVRLYQAASGPRLKIYRLGGALALSDAVPVLENFGFRVIEEVPTALSDEAQGFVHDFAIAAGEGSSRSPLAGDTPVLEQAIAAVLEGHAENDAFNRLIADVGLAPSAVVLFRAWFRYLRQAE